MLRLGDILPGGNGAPSHSLISAILAAGMGGITIHGSSEGTQTQLGGDANPLSTVV